MGNFFFVLKLELGSRLVYEALCVFYCLFASGLLEEMILFEAFVDDRWNDGLHIRKVSIRHDLPGTDTLLWIQN